MSESKKQTLHRLPETGQFPLSLEIVPDVIELGRLINKTIHEWAASKGKENLHVRVIEHAFNHVILLHQEKQAVLADDFLRADRLIRQENLGDLVNEPHVRHLENQEEVAAQIDNAGQKIDPTLNPAKQEEANTEAAA